MTGPIVWTSTGVAPNCLLVAILAGVPSTAKNAETDDQILKIVNNTITDIKIDTLREMQKKDRNLLLIDVRTEREINIVGGMIGAPETLKTPRGWLKFRIQDVAPK